MTPQYDAVKVRHPGMLLLFRAGDFYELFGEDAETAAGVLGLCLSQRPDPATRAQVSLAGFPHSLLEPYLQQLLKAGQRVAICNGEVVAKDEGIAMGLPALF